MRPARTCSRVLRVGLACGGLACLPCHAEITPEQAQALQNVISSRIEALTIFGGDYGLAGGSFVSHGKFSADTDDDA
jgi:hypothetical protein